MQHQSTTGNWSEYKFTRYTFSYRKNPHCDNCGIRRPVIIRGFSARKKGVKQRRKQTKKKRSRGDKIVSGKMLKQRERTQGKENLALDVTNTLTTAHNVGKICGIEIYLNMKCY